MELEHLIRARAHRILRHFTHYQKISREIASSPNYIKEISAQADEEFIGVYENFLGERNESVVITTLGLHIFVEDKWVFINYKQINHIESPPKEHSVEELVIHLHSGEVIKIPIKGNGGDVWEFLRFLMRVTDDVNKR